MPELTLVPAIKVLNDQASPTILYTGYASAGTSSATALWQISKTTFDGDGVVLSIEWAGGNGNPSHVWNDRATYVYS